MSKKRLIPFKLLPAAWGLKGKSFETAKAEYELDGIDLEIRLAEINFGMQSKEARANRVVREFRLGKLSEHEQERQLVDIIEADEVKAFKLLETDFRFHRISQYEFDKQVALLHNVEAEKPKLLLDVDFKHNKLTHHEYDTQSALLQELDEELPKILLAIDLKHNKINQYDHDTRVVYLEQDETIRSVNLLGVELKHNRLTAYEHDVKVAELETDETAKEIALLATEFAHKKISEQEFEKRTHTLREEPWVTVDIALDPTAPTSNGAFELDWNEYFILELRQSGYTGISDSEIVDQWFSMTCATVAAEQGIVLPEPVSAVSAPEIAAKKRGRPKKEDTRREYR